MRYYAEYGSPLDGVSIWSTIVPCVVVLWPLIMAAWAFVDWAARRLWRRYGAAIQRVAFAEIRLECVDRAFAAARAVVVNARSRFVFTAAGRRRELGRLLAAEPRHSGLTLYEEFEAEIKALPPGPARSALRRYLRNRVGRPSADLIAKARRKRGETRCPEGIIRALKRGEVPYILQHKER